MSDLISRKALLEFLDSQIKDVSETVPNRIYTKTALTAMRTTGQAVKRYVNQMPTAYDVDKVVEQISNYLDGYSICKDYDKEFFMYLEEFIINIVKGAVKDE